MHSFRAVIQSNGKTATGIEVPAEIVQALGSGKRPKVRATIAGYTYRSSVAPMGGRSLLGVSAQVREQVGVAAGDEVEVELVHDTQPREVTVPDDLAGALAADDAAQRFFEGLSYSQGRWFVLGVEDAKTPETRRRRIDKAVARLREGRGQR